MLTTTKPTRRFAFAAFAAATTAAAAETLNSSSSSSSTTAANPGSWATRGISMAARETAQPEVASESWWEVIQGARGAGVLAPGASGWG
eukprot:scaffold97108_cov54-Phaeocystis_antarctica.AAC.1